MGLLRIENEVFQHEPDILPMLLTWFRRECNATVYQVHIYNDVTEFYIEGHDIPEGRKQFGVTIEEIVPQVLSVGVIT